MIELKSRVCIQLRLPLGKLEMVLQPWMLRQNHIYTFGKGIVKSENIVSESFLNLQITDCCFFVVFFSMTSNISQIFFKAVKDLAFYIMSEKILLRELYILSASFLVIVCKVY